MRQTRHAHYRFRTAPRPRLTTPRACSRLITGLAEYENLTHLVEATPEKLREALFGARPHAEAVLVEVPGAQGAEAVGLPCSSTTVSTLLAKPGLYLEDLYVDPGPGVSHGLGKMLLKHLAALAVERGCGRFEWSDVLDWNTPSIEFYRAMGADVMPDWRICRVTGEALTKLGAAG
ncbi:N-acetyltransferase family protein [Cupriavidus basilensis]